MVDMSYQTKQILVSPRFWICVTLTRREIKTEITINFSHFIRSGSMLLHQKLSVMAFLYRLHVEVFGRLSYMTEFSPMVRETGVQSQVESYQRLKKWYLIPSCLTLSITKYGWRAKWSNPGKGVTPTPLPRGFHEWKGSLRVTLDYGHYLYIYIYIYT